MPPRLSNVQLCGCTSIAETSSTPHEGLDARFSLLAGDPEYHRPPPSSRHLLQDTREVFKELRAHPSLWGRVPKPSARPVS